MSGRDAQDGRRPHVNADRALPAALCAALRAETGGGGVYLWLPGERAHGRRRRAERVVSLRSAGRTVREIAAEVGLTERRCFQILAEQRAERAPQVSSDG